MQLGAIDQLWLIDTGCIVLTAINATGCDPSTLLLASVLFVAIVAFGAGERLDDVAHNHHRWCVQSFLLVGADCGWCLVTLVVVAVTYAFCNSSPSSLC
jgi:NhaP-type Na+/H+ or K+/H+ antiporter